MIRKPVGLTGWTLATICFCLLAGCRDSGKHAIGGTVTLDNEPINGGSIVFLPSGDGAKGAAEIVNGAYSIPSEQGLPPGDYRVEIVWNKPTGKQIPSGDPGMMMDERQQVVPAKYNAQSTLTIKLGAGENKQSFNLTTQ